MISNRAVRRFDQFDYESMGLDERWYIHKTAEMLTSFEMETKNYFDLDDSHTIYNKINDKYLTLINNALYEGDLPYITPNAIEFADRQPSFVVCTHTTFFSQDSFIGYISKNNKTSIDVEKLKRFLSGEQQPDIERKSSIAACETRPNLQVADDKGVITLAKPRNEKMLALSLLSHKSAEEVKDVIRRFVKEAMKPPCTCMNSQMKRYIIKLSKKEGSGISLKYKTSSGEKTISENVLRKVVNDTMGESRIQTKNMVLLQCSEHGTNNY